MTRFLTAILCVCGAAIPLTAAEPTAWVKHVVHSGEHCNAAVVGDFTGDGKPDIVSQSGRACRLFTAPYWRESVIHEHPDHGCIHAESMDVDDDGDLDFIGVRYSPGLIFWLENPGPQTGTWNWHLVDDQVDGIHGLLVGDVNRDGRSDLVANSAQPQGSFPESVVWYAVPNRDPRKPWRRTVVAQRDAPGLTHYLGLGDLNGDGRPDVMTAAKGGPTAPPGSGDWFAWWEAPEDPFRSGWKKHLIADKELAATNILPADVDGDGRPDVICTRGHGFGLCWFKGPDWTRTDFANDLEGPHCLTLADFDGDGDVDAATCAKDSKVTAWFENDGKGTFTVHRIDDDQAAYDIRSFDIDADGDPDLLVAGQTSKNVVWYENRMPAKP